MTELFCLNAPVHFAILPAVAPFVVTGVCASVDETPPIVSASKAAPLIAILQSLIRPQYTRLRDSSTLVSFCMMRLPSFREIRSAHGEPHRQIGRAHV